MDLPVTTLILALKFFTLVDCETMMKYQSEPRLIGETVTVSYVADPSIGHGQFLLENYEAYAVTASVESAWLELGTQRHPLTGISVYDLDREQAVNPKSFNVGAGVTMKFLVGFPKLAYDPRFGEFTAVNLRLNVNDAELQALSPIVFERRIPRNQPGKSY